MKKKFLIQLFIISLVCCNSFSQSKIDVLHYEYNINLNDKNDTLEGVAVIRFVALEKMSSVQFDLYGPDKQGKGMRVTAVCLDAYHERCSPFKQENEKLIITLTLNKGDTTSIIINYKGVPDDGLIISKNKYGDRTFFADNWPNRAHHWLPCIDRPDDKANFTFVVSAPSHYSVISNGIKTEEKEIADGKKLTIWKEETPLPTKIMVIGVSRFAVKTFDDSPSEIPVSAWVYPQDSTEGFKNYSPAPAILKFLSDYIGAYPYKKLANVQSKTIFGGMENAGAIFYSEQSATSEETIESLLTHEIAHQWFGDMASEKSFPHLWLSEGFATYLTHIYIESKYGTDSLNTEMKKERMEIIAFAKESGKPIVDSVSPLMQLLNTNSYQKGGWILHMLRRQLGDSVFHKIIRSYYAAYAGKNADTRDFQRICENESGKDLNIFFDQWLYAPGLPKLEVQWKYDVANKTVLVTVRQLQKNLFQFPLEIQIEAGRTKKETLLVTQQTQQFRIPLIERPTELYLDPHTSLLFEGSITLTK